MGRVSESYPDPFENSRGVSPDVQLPEDSFFSELFILDSPRTSFWLAFWGSSRSYYWSFSKSYFFQEFFPGFVLLMIPRSKDSPFRFIKKFLFYFLRKFLRRSQKKFWLLPKGTLKGILKECFYVIFEKKNFRSNPRMKYWWNFGRKSWRKPRRMDCRSSRIKF